MAQTRAKRFSTADQAFELEFIQVDTDRERGGWILKFTSNATEDPTVMMATVAVHTTYYLDRYYHERGQELFDLRLAEIRSATLDYSEKFGHRFRVTSFTAPVRKGHDTKIIVAQFVEMFFAMYSSHRFNSDSDDAGDGFYPDILEFMPEEMDPIYYLTAQAGAASTP
ncbi:hypothetical protein [Ensifer sp. MJa1]|uniref:hypothetical protein n=1 Tax=Ensifer sp. MJa1 TaxID=2919888 RepID=UPI003009EFA9